MSFGCIPPIDPAGHVERWNRAHPPGTVVFYQPILGHSKLVETVTTSEASVMGGHSAMVRVEGVSGLVSLRNVLLKVPAPVESPEEFYLLSVKHSPIGEAELAMWWSPHRAGYTPDLRVAGRYSATEIASKFFAEGDSIPVPVSLALSVSTTVMPWALAQTAFVNFRTEETQTK